MAYDKKDMAGEICQEFENLASDRVTFEDHWEQIAERVLPAKRNTIRQGSYSFPGSRKTEYQFDSTAALALSKFKSICASLLTPENSKWSLLKPSNPYLAKSRNVRLYFEAATNALWDQRRRPTANFSGQNVMIWELVGAFGTGAIFTDELRTGPGMRYRAIPIGETFIGENHQGLVDRFYRPFKQKAYQLAQRWGYDNLPQQIKDAARSEVAAQRNKDWTVLHCVKPNERYEPGRYDALGKPFFSGYLVKDLKEMLSTGGFSSFPYSVARYEQEPGEVYGRSPAMSVLPAIKTLNEEKKAVLKQGHRALDPTLLAHDDGIVDGFSLRPGVINPGAVNADGRPLVHALPTGNPIAGKELMDDERQVINDAFLVTLFQILVETPQMTATEVLERTREKGILLAPTVGRQQSEFLGPMIERELDVLAQQGLLPPMPPELIEARGEYQVEYDNPMARAAKAEEGAGFQRTLETTLTIANVTQDPSTLDHFDFDTIVPEMARNNAVPERWMASEDKIAAKRQARADQAQQQQMIQAAPGAAAMTKALTVAQKGGK